MKLRPEPILLWFGQAVVGTCRNVFRNFAEEFFDFMLSRRIQKPLFTYGFDSVSSIVLDPAHTLHWPLL